MLKLQESTFLDTLSRLALFAAPEETSIPSIRELPPVTQRYIPVTQRYIHVTLRYIHVTQRYIHVTQRYIHVTAGDWLLGEDLGVVHVESDAGPSDKVDVRNEIRRLVPLWGCGVDFRKIRFRTCFILTYVCGHVRPAGPNAL